MQTRGVADFIERLAGDYRQLWRSHGGETCLKTFKEYTRFLKGRRKVTFIRFTNFRELENPVSMKALNKVLGVLKVPRGGKYINQELTKQLTT